MKDLATFKKTSKGKYEIKFNGEASYEEMNYFAARLAEYVTKHWAKRNNMTVGEAAEAYATMLVANIVEGKGDK